MKYIISLLFLGFTMNLSAQNNNEPFKFPAKLKEMRDMVFVPGGTFTMGKHSGFDPQKKDSNLLCCYLPMRVTCINFFISNHEVTNKEYGLFVTWVQDSIKRKTGRNIVTPEETLYEFKDEHGKQILNIYPDTTRWTSEFPYQYNDPMSMYYHKHPTYDDYPVVGISYREALAYCIWKTFQINLQMPKGMFARIRLPYEGEWEYAALYRTPPKDQNDNIQDIYLYPWNNFSLQDEKGKYNANFGNIEDENGLILKSYMDDNATYTALARSFVTNDLGLYNMSGNVAEWVQGVPDKLNFTDSLGMKVQITHQDDINTVINKLRSIKYLNQFDRERIESVAIDYMHDADLLHRILEPKTVKGGSWADAVIYIQPGTKEVQNESYTSCRIGFRIAMDVFDQRDTL